MYEILNSMPINLKYCISRYYTIAKRLSHLCYIWVQSSPQCRHSVQSLSDSAHHSHTDIATGIHGQIY